MHGVRRACWFCVHRTLAKPVSCSPLSNHPACINSRVHVHEPLHMWWSLHVSCLHGPCEDHFGKITSKQPSDGPMIVSEPCRHVWQHTDGRHRSLRSIGATSLYTSVEAHVLTVSLPVRHVLTVLIQSSCLSCADCFACVGLLSCIAHLDHADRIIHVQDMLNDCMC